MMRLVRYGEKGQEKPGLLDSKDQIRDLSDQLPDLTGPFLSTKSLKDLARLNPDKLPLIEGSPRLGAPVAGSSKVIGVAINYRMHGIETGSREPSEPVLFLKAPSAICGSHDPIYLPKGSEKTDWEVELAVIIGKEAKNIKVDEAPFYIAGYCIVDDVSERAFQLERGGQQHTKGKSADSFCPLGPFILTSDELPDPQSLRLWTKVDGVIMQDGSTADMLFSVKQLVSYISEFMTLLPGDVIATGTPDGVGRGKTPPRYLKSGEIIELGIDKLGVQKHTVL